MADTPQEIQKAKKAYLIVFSILIIGTISTVLVATVPWLDVGAHGFDMADCILGLLIASFKASCVGYVFMHLNHEKKAIYWIFFGSLLLAIFLYALTALAFGSPLLDPNFYGK